MLAFLKKTGSNEYECLKGQVTGVRYISMPPQNYVFDLKLSNFNVL